MCSYTSNDKERHCWLQIPLINFTSIFKTKSNQIGRTFNSHALIEAISNATISLHAKDWPTSNKEEVLCLTFVCFACMFTDFSVYRRPIWFCFFERIFSRGGHILTKSKPDERISRKSRKFHKFYKNRHLSQPWVFKRITFYK